MDSSKELFIKTLKHQKTQRSIATPHWWGIYKYEAAGLDYRKDSYRQGGELFKVCEYFLQRDELKTLMVGITIFKSRYTINIPLTMIGFVMVTIPMVALYLFGQKYFVRGLTSGVVKEEC